MKSVSIISKKSVQSPLLKTEKSVFIGRFCIMFSLLMLCLNNVLCLTVYADETCDVISHNLIIDDYDEMNVHMVEGFCSDGKGNLYYSVYMGSDNRPSIIKKYNINTGETISSDEYHVYGHANGMAYIPEQNAIYITSLDDASTIYIVDADSLEYRGEFSNGEAISSNFDGALKAGAVAFDKGTGLILYLISPYNSKRAYAFFTVDNDYVNGFEFEKFGTAGGLAADKDYIYQTYQREEGQLYVYDKKGTVLSVLSVGYYYEIEGVAIDEGQFYFAYNSTDRHHIYIEQCDICFHNIEIDPAIKPSFFSSGLTEGKHCSKCGQIFVEQEEIPRKKFLWW